MSQNVLEQISIDTPCSQSWDKMSGDDKVRFCTHCRKNVYNLSEMTRAEAESRIFENGEQLCGRVFRRKDGTIVTADCPRQSSKYPIWIAAVLAVFTGCGSLIASTPIIAKWLPTVKKQIIEAEEPMMGAVSPHYYEPVHEPAPENLKNAGEVGPTEAV